MVDYKNKETKRWTKFYGGEDRHKIEMALQFEGFEWERQRERMKRERKKAMFVYWHLIRVI